MADVRVDQVMVRKVGGWNMVTLEWWMSQPVDEQRSLLSQEAVQFFYDGELLDTKNIVQALGGPVDAIAGGSGGEQKVVAWPPTGGEPPLCTYTRVVVAGPRWEVQRTDDSGVAVPFETHMGRDDFEPYDLDGAAGARALAVDLLGDALGAGRNPDAVIGQAAVEHFIAHAFTPKLGNRAWQITNRQVRTLLSENPYVRFEAAASV